MALPTTQTLRSLLSLSEKRDALQAQLNQINTQLEAALAGKASETVTSPSKAPDAPKAAKAGKRGKRGALKDLIVEALTVAGDAGVAVKDLASQLGKKTQNIHVWFATTGKSLGAKKVRPGVYALGKTSPASAPKEVAPETPAKPVKSKKAKAAKRRTKKA